MKPRKILILLTLIVNCIFIDRVFADKDVPKTYNIPVLIPLTGSAAEQGEWIRQGVELAQESFNKKSKIKVSSVFEDTQADPKIAISAYQKIKSQSSFPAVITYGSGVCVAMSSITNKDQVIQMGVATSSPAYRSPDDYTFRNFPSADVDAAFLVKSILEKFNEKEIAIINVQNEYGVSSKKAVKDLFISKGGKVIFEDEIEPNGIDYRSIILKLKAANPKIVYFAVYPLEGAVFLKQAKSLGLSTTFIAGPAIIGSSKFMELSGNAAEGLIVVSTEPVFLKNKSTEIEEFNNSYLSKYGKRPSLEQIYAARAYDAFFLIANGIENCLNSSSECLKNYLYKVRTYPGVSGEISFDKNGDVLSKFELEVVKEGQFVEFK